MSTLRSLLRFLLVGGLSYAVDLGALYLLHGRLSLGLAPATLLAFLLALVVNFTLNRSLSFAAAPGRVRRQFLRYCALCAVNYGLTLLGVLGLVELGTHYLVAKTVMVGVGVAVNFVLCRYWVFPAVSHRSERPDYHPSVPV
ncbi:GtrA family protein [Nonomuraea sp. NPDC050790]|uniref:GtrA family protein n=1 Tax=Nonomuraea sp. NPDC050790 TaxID=3364371 RepID=UPI00379DEA71